MRCPSCRCAAPGGTSCPCCGATVPEREAFSGLGGHYWRVLFVFSLLFTVGFILTSNRGHGLVLKSLRIFEQGWFWPYFVLLFIPNFVGAYYWFMLREEELIVTDEYIERRSRWGDERLAWADVRAFCRRPMLYRHTRLGRVAGLSRFFRHHRLIARIPRLGYDLVGPPDAEGDPFLMQLEPGTIEDMPWLLALIEERVGPPRDTLAPMDADTS